MSFYLVSPEIYAWVILPLLIFLARMLAELPVSVTRLASGLPVGGDLEFADEVTLGRAFAGRRSLD